ncbi:MAG: hypothetical protein RDU89_10815 [bacterium]|nr:hypothetical protein [bacterium]
MFSFTLRFADETMARSAARRLVNRFKVTGEVTTMPLAEGGWLLAVDSERKLPESCLKGLERTAGRTSG